MVNFYFSQLAPDAEEELWGLSLQRRKKKSDRDGTI